VSESCAVVIAMADVLPTLKERTAAVNGEVLSFSETEALRALDAIMTRRPQLVRLERTFASTPRGVALINRIKSDPALVDMGIEVVTHDTDETRVVRQGAPRKLKPAPTRAPAKAAAAHAAAPAAAEAPPPLAPPVKKPPIQLAPRAAAIAPPGRSGDAPPHAADAPPQAAAAEPAERLDQRGTREAPRFRMEPGLEVTVDGNPARLIDLSAVGAQVIASGALKPNQRVRVALNDDAGSVKLTGKVVWASFEITKTGPRYRAGLQFVKPDAPAIEAFCSRHKSA
jgi:hypothetical protein